MSNPHILVIPYPAQGHIIPLMKLSQQLAEHGFRITFVDTQYNHERILNALAMEEETGDHIQLVSVSDGLTGEDRTKAGKLSEASLRVLPGRVEELIQQINGSESKITCVLADQSIGWALDIAERHGIKHAAFCPAAAAMLVLGFSIPKLIEDGIIDKNGAPMKGQTVTLSSGMPAMQTENFVWACLGNINTQRNIFELMVRNNEYLKSTDWLLCNSTYDLEPGALSFAPKIRPIGPILASNRLGEIGGNFWSEDLNCLRWLDGQAPQSVIYVAFGSLTVFNPIQIQELALGLEITNRPFLWVNRPDLGDRRKEAYPEGFQDRVATRGKMIGWAPQKKVLAHPSIACFISHCGWNSAIEGVSSGIPFLCWPYFADQFLNQSYISDFWNVGMRLNKDERGIVTRDEINNKIEELLGNHNYKVKALTIKEMVMRNIKEGGRSYKNFMDFIEWVKQK